MAYTAPGTAVAGDVLTAAFWNQQVRDNMEAVAGAPFARNILYNGAMQISQRGTSTASITTSGYYTADRWSLAVTTQGTWTNSVENDAPTGSGLRRSLKVLCTTADASPAAGDRVFLQQPLEGYDVQRVLKGTSSAQALTISFWTKANVTGTYVVSLYDNDNNRHCSKTYTISASATWEQKTVTFPADTTGVFDNDNNASLYLVFYLGAGSSWTSGSLATSWASFTAANDAVGQTNLASAINNYWQVTGVQLEVGSAATGFEFLPYGDELARCQRYFYQYVNGNTQDIGLAFYYQTYQLEGFVSFPVVMRTSPTMSTVVGTSYYVCYRSGSANNLNGLTPDTITSRNATFYNNTEASGTLGVAGILRTQSASAGISFSAEL